MSTGQDASSPDPLDRLQPDGNFRDDDPETEDSEAQEAAQRLAVEREANRVGPRHPAHGMHAQWRTDHGLPPAD